MDQAPPSRFPFPPSTRHDRPPICDLRDGGIGRRDEPLSDVCWSCRSGHVFRCQWGGREQGRIPGNTKVS